MLDLKSGDVFAGCTVLSVCGRGGFGVVYLAEDAVGRKVALKIVSTPDKERELRGIRMFMKESGRSPHLLGILHVGVEQGELYYLMQAADPLPDSPYYIADTLGKRLQLHGRLAPAEALTVIRKLAGAVRTLHAAELIHRDIKPDNVIFVHGEPMLSDPGLICSTDCSISLAGTIGFLPPECFSGEEANSKQSDIYALGKLFYCMITGEAPGRFPHLPHDLPYPVCRKLMPVLFRACNTKKKKRYTDIAEFERDLPVRLPRSSRVCRWREEFRTWRLMHAPLCRTVLLVLLAAVALGAFGAWSTARRREMRREELARFDAEAAAFRDKVARGGELLVLQLENAIGESAAASLKTALNELPAGSERAARQSRKLASELRKAAQTAVRRAKTVADPLKRSAQLRALVQSPLGTWLDDTEREELADFIASDARQHLKLADGTPQLEQTYYSDSSRIFEFAYVPPGEFLSPTTRRKVRIDYPLWVGTTELTVRQFSRLLRFIPSGNRDMDMPVTRILWNDLLHASRVAAGQFAISGAFPAGYIVRPLTEEEWEYCALAGMRPGQRGEEWNAERKSPGVHPAGRLAANAFGLHDMCGNVREMVLRRAGAPSRPGGVPVRGGDSSTPAKRQLVMYSESAFFQSFSPNIGTRLAVAPGTPELLKREFRSDATGHLVFQGRHYEYLGHLCAGFTRKEAEMTCRLLGGRLASLDPPELLAQLVRNSCPTIGYPTCVAAEFRDGKWMWANGREIRNPPPAPQAGRIVALRGGRLTLDRSARYLGFVCEWSEEEYRKRTAWRERISGAPLLAAFRIGDREYALFRMFAYPHLARRYAELLGGRLAEPETPELRRAIAEKLRKFADKPVLLGGIWEDGSYHWITSGDPISEALELKGQVIDNAPSLATPALDGEKLCAIELADQFLVEFPAVSPDRR